MPQRVWPPSPTTPDWRSTSSVARRASSRPGGQGSTADDRANLDLLLAQLSDVPDEHRGAGFVCAAALVTPAGLEHVEHGRIDGRLTRSARGGNGFGYDPILELPDGRTLAELGAAEKNAISHRSQAFRALAPHVLAALG